MTPPADLDPDRRLHAERPVPAPAWRGELRRRIASLERSGYGRPPLLRLAILAYAASGSLLVAIGLAGALGAGPLAP